jgi:ATP-dependent helicase/nuclease subunit B
MSVRFILGRAGTGKTHHCLAAVRRRLREDPLKGNHAILLVPEQASLQMERSLIEDPAVGAFSRAEVLSFRRLALRVLHQTGGLKDNVLTPLGRLMVLRHLLGRHRRELRCYGRVLDKPGFVAELAGTVIELMHEQVEPAALRDALERLDPDSMSARKLHDVAAVYAAYHAYLAGGPDDPEQYLDVAARRLCDCPWLHGCELWVDGFAGFTRQETSLLVELVRLADRAEIALLLDPADLDDPSLEELGGGFGLFAATHRTYAELRQRFSAAGLPVEDSTLLAPPAPPRFTSVPDLAQLERAVFVAGHQPPSQATAGRCGVELHSFPSRRLEVEAALCRVQELVRRCEDALRYRDIALVLRDAGPYHDLISAACLERNIPVFLDRRRPLAHHPLVELMRSLCLLGSQDFSLEAVCLLIKTGLLPIEDYRLDALENFLLAYGIAGARLWTEREWGYWNEPGKCLGARIEKQIDEKEQSRIRDANRTRRLILHHLGPWVDLCTKGVRQNARAWTAALEQVLDSLKIRDRLEAMAVEAEEDGRPAEAMEHRQAWSEASAVLRDLRDGLGRTEMDLPQFGEILGAGLAELTLGLAPPTLDQLLVGTIERSRHPALRAVLLLGFNEGVFPRVPPEPRILNDDDRDALAEASPQEDGRAAIRLGATRRRRLDEERFLGYVALTRASESLWISFAQADEQGKELFPSPFVREVVRALPGLEVQHAGDPGDTRRADTVGSAAELAGRLAGELGTRPPQSGEDSKPAQRATWNLLYDRCRTDDTLVPALRRAVASLAYVNEARLGADAVQRLYGRAVRNSVTRLECFASCPFRHFADYGLGLAEREEHRLEAVDWGKLSHLAVERFVREIIAEGIALNDLDDAAIEHRLSRLAGQAAAYLYDELRLGEARNRYLIERCSRDLSRFARGMRTWSRRSGFRPRAVELAFGLAEEGSLPALVLHTPKGRRLELCGRIDRADVAELGREALFAVIDYKRQTARRLSLAEVYHGLALQLVTYLLALREHGRTWLGRQVQPAGAFYLPLLSRYRSVAHPGDAARGEDAAEDAWQARGLLNAEHFEVFDGQTTSGRSPVVSAYVKKDGSFGHLDSTDVAAAGQFAAVMDHVAERIVELGDRMLDGEIAVLPARLGHFIPCTYCRYRSVCRFDYQTNAPRTLPEMSRSQAMDKMRRPGG